jgi:dTDP-4-amino-4,6-dideoxygalactose transaminase
MITADKELHEKLFYHHNFGHNGPEDFHGIGINAKTSELQAAMGLAVFNHLDEIFKGRKNAVGVYDEFLDFSKIKKIFLFFSQKSCIVYLIGRSPPAESMYYGMPKGDKLL